MVAVITDLTNDVDRGEPLGERFELGDQRLNQRVVLLIQPTVQVLELSGVNPLVGDKIATPAEMSRVIRTPVFVCEGEGLPRDVVNYVGDVLGGVDHPPAVVGDFVAGVEVRNVTDPVLVAGRRVKLSGRAVQPAEATGEFIVRLLPPPIRLARPGPLVLGGPDSVVALNSDYLRRLVNVDLPALS